MFGTKYLYLASVLVLGALSGADIAEIARMYSAEIEYAPDNTEKILNLLE